MQGVVSYDGGVVSYDGGVVSYDGGVVSYDGGVVSYDGGVVSYDDGVFSYDGGAVSYDDGVISDGRMKDEIIQTATAQEISRYRLTRAHQSNSRPQRTFIVPPSSFILAFLVAADSRHLISAGGIGNRSAHRYGRPVGHSGTHHRRRNRFTRFRAADY